DGAPVAARCRGPAAGDLLLHQRHPLGGLRRHPVGHLRPPAGDPARVRPARVPEPRWRGLPGPGRRARAGRRSPPRAMSPGVAPGTLALLSLGSNIEPERYLRAALDELRHAFALVAVSPAYRTAAVGFDGADFLNNAACIRTSMPLAELEDWLHALEDRHGRRRDGPRLANRTLDVDVVFYGDCVLRDGARVRVPRPELRHAFVLKPMADIAAGFVDPLSGRTLGELWRAHPQHGDAFEAISL